MTLSPLKKHAIPDDFQPSPDQPADPKQADMLLRLQNQRVITLQDGFGSFSGSAGYSH
jgi:hypothetical protein